MNNEESLLRELFVGADLTGSTATHRIYHKNEYCGKRLQVLTEDYAAHEQ